MKIICGFPGVGKTFFKENNGNINILDSDSSKFSWIEKGIRNSQFPKNYIEHIKNSMYKFDIILVSTHKIVRDSLVNNGIKFLLVYPEIDLKEEYIERFKKRGSDTTFIRNLRDNWDGFIHDLENQTGCESVRLKSGWFLGDIFVRSLSK